MTTEIPTATSRTVRLRCDQASRVVRIEFIEEDGYRSTAGEVSDQSLLDAVRSELGVATFNKAVLAPMSTEQAIARVQEARGLNRVPTADDLAATVSSALSLLDAVEHLESQPAIDEEAVAALANILEGVVGGCADGWDWADVARQTIRSGRVDVQS